MPLAARLSSPVSLPKPKAANNSKLCIEQDCQIQRRRQERAPMTTTRKIVRWHQIRLSPKPILNRGSLRTFQRAMTPWMETPAISIRMSCKRLRLISIASFKTNCLFRNSRWMMLGWKENKLLRVTTVKALTYRIIISSHRRYRPLIRLFPLVQSLQLWPQRWPKTQCSCSKSASTGLRSTCVAPRRK